MEYRNPPHHQPPPSESIDDSEERIRQLEEEMIEEHSRAMKEEARIRARVTETYRQVWQEFYLWELEDCGACLSSLCVQDPGIPAFNFDSFGADYRTTFDSMDVDHGSEFEPVIWESDSDDWFTLPVESVISLEWIKPHPRYDACTPSQNNIVSKTFDNFVEELGAPKVLSFIKYAGEVGFDDYRYALQFPSFAWQVEFVDPDWNIIYSLTIYRLTSPDVTDEPMSTTDIDESNIFPNPVTDISFLTSQRDPIFWQAPALAHDWKPPSGSLSYEIECMNHTFCQYLSCITSMCFTHLTTWRSHLRKPPTKTSTKLSARECGPSCFRSLSADDIAEEDVNKADNMLIQELLLLSPDASPCDLAVIARIPCSEVFKLRCHILPDFQIKGKKGAQQNILMPKYFEDAGFQKSEKLALVWPCQHSGPCDKRHGCECHMRNLHCQPSCYCSQSCKSRWKGCQCKKCDEENCPCVSMGWECIPHVCHSKVEPKQSSTERTSKECTNTKIQTNVSNKLQVKPGSYGLGVYAIRAIKPKVYIGEYISEIFRNTDVTRVMNQDFSDLNYRFDNSSDCTLDAITVGNETRYINHAKPPNNNVDGIVKIVNGEQRIGFWTIKDIKKGEELFVDYGETYWLSHRPEEDEH